MKRRSFLVHGAAALGAGTLGYRVAAQAPAAPVPIRIGTCTVGLPQALAAGLDGVEINAGGAAERLAIADDAARQRYKAEIAGTKLPVCSLMMALLNEHPLASDPRGPAWLDQCIDAARDLGAKVVLVAFFGNGDMLDAAGQPKQDAIDEVVRRLKQAAPRAKESGVVLGIENYLDGGQNERILDRVGHESVQVYYDVFNTGTTKGHDVPADLKRLQGRIAQLHFKNGPKYLDAEPEKFGPIAAAVKETGFRGWAVLETSSPSGDPVADARRNGEYLRKLLA